MQKEKVRIAVQGIKGSASYAVASHISNKVFHRFVPCFIEAITTDNVLNLLFSSKADIGVYAYFSEGVGYVKETQRALARYPNPYVLYKYVMKIEHALFVKQLLDKSAYRCVVSHPQALKRHRPFLSSVFPNVEFIEEKDTALAVKYLAEGRYGDEALAIGLKQCSTIYPVKLYPMELPTNKGYKTTFHIVCKREDVKYF